MAQQKKRLDTRLLELYPTYSRQQLQGWIMQGKVRVNEVVITKPGTQVRDNQVILLTAEQQRFVCRAGWKLEKALEVFNIDVSGKIILDAGLSTGGFADCLLQYGAHKVYGVDVGHGQAHEKMRQDPRVVVMERTNLRYLTPDILGDRLDIVTLDLSFISVLKVMSAVTELMKPQGQLVILIKPQFEALRSEVPRGGVIVDPSVQQRAIDRVVEGTKEFGFAHHGTIESPILGGAGNKEFLAYFTKV